MAPGHRSRDFLAIIPTVPRARRVKDQVPTRRLRTGKTGRGAAKSNHDIRKVSQRRNGLPVR